jgi:hypothetical protein
MKITDLKSYKVVAGGNTGISANDLPKKETGERGLRGFATGMGKSVGQLAVGTGELLQKIGNAPTRAIFGAEVTQKAGINALKDSTTQNQKLNQTFGADGSAERFGKTVGDIITFAAPSGKVTAATKGKGLLTRTIAEGVSGGSITALQEGGINKDTRDAAVISALFPSAAKVLSTGKVSVQKVLKKNAPRLINSLIKPASKELSYGKNPGRSVAEEGIVAQDFDDLSQKIGQKKNLRGEEIREIYRSRPDARVDLADSFEPLDNAIVQAKKNPRTNSALINRLEDLKADLLGAVEDGAGGVTYSRKLSDINPEEAFQFKEDISDLTKYTGNASDDSLINSSLQKIYGNIKNKLNTSVSGVKSKSGMTIEELNERYADLSAAKIATDNRDKIVERQNIISLPANVAAGSTAIITAITSGGAAIPTILAGASVAAMEKYLSTPKAKTKIAAWIAKSTPEERKRLFDAIPTLKAAIVKTYIGD